MKYLMILILLSSCLTAKKFSNQLDKGNDKFPATAAEFCNKEYPLVIHPISTDSSAYKHYMDSINALIPDTLTNTIHDTTCLDSNSHYQRIILALQSKIKALKNAPAIRDSFFVTSSRDSTIYVTTLKKATRTIEKKTNWLYFFAGLSSILFLLLIILLYAKRPGNARTN